MVKLTLPDRKCVIILIIALISLIALFKFIEPEKDLETDQTQSEEIIVNFKTEKTIDKPSILKQDVHEIDSLLPEDMAFFSLNNSGPECCTVQYLPPNMRKMYTPKEANFQCGSKSSGCICMSPDQWTFMANRGGNA
mgnify:FL=1